ncbi:hypothetical protein F4604DRAFT_1899179 [Suillus subluteus]|nr:hypothetical protein F4604DRAFT_1899179 [Suillus subluteus]
MTFVAHVIKENGETRASRPPADGERDMRYLGSADARLTRMEVSPEACIRIEAQLQKFRATQKAWLEAKLEELHAWRKATLEEHRAKSAADYEDFKAKMFARGTCNDLLQD